MKAETQPDEAAGPLLPEERTWGPLRLGITLATTAAATWCYLIGESVGTYLGFLAGSFALTAGCMVGMLLVLLAAGPICARFGVDSIASTKPQFGSRGWVIPAALQAISIVGWNSLLIIFFAKSAVQLLTVLGILSAQSPTHSLTPILTALACLVIFLALRSGARGVSAVSNVLVAHVLVGLWMLYLLVTHRWNDLVLTRPALARADPLWNYTTGFELGIATTLSWWPYLGAMVRMAPSGRCIVLPVMLGMGAPVALLSLIGIAGVLVLKSSDPAEWLRSVGGTLYAIVALGFVTAANFGTAIAGVYASALGLRNLRSLQRASWIRLLLLTIAPVAFIGLSIPDLFFARFGSFLALIGVAFAPLCGIQISDYFWVRRGRVAVGDLFRSDKDSRYFFRSGFNPAGVLALVLGCIVYVTLLNPLTYLSASVYRYTTASLPAALTAALAYAVLMRVFRPA